ncbi:MAG: flagellar motor protein MotB [Vampirovibrionales bacterium]|nr:flagellar motor protein MotB [Vampirovibrionales bacterium]
MIIHAKPPKPWHRADSGSLPKKYASNPARPALRAAFNNTDPLQRFESPFPSDPVAQTLGTQSGQRWLMPYADMITVLLGLLLVLLATTHQTKTVAETKLRHFQAIAHQAQQSLAIRESEMTILAQKLSASLSPSPKPQTSADNTEQKSLQTAQNKISVENGQEGVVITLPETVVFAPGEAQLTSTALPTLNKLADIIRQKGQHVRVEGHTDNTPIATAEFPSNWELSTARATTIARYLVEKMGLPANQISAAGYGEYRPVAENSSDEGKRQNRRVAIVLLNEPLMAKRENNDVATLHSTTPFPQAEAFGSPP